MKRQYHARMFAAVEKLYRDGMHVTPQQPRLVGRLRSDFDATDARRQCLKLWPVDFIESVRDNYTPQAVLWLPELVGIVGDHVLIRGLEEVERHPKRGWVFQKWRCEVLTSQQAKSHLQPDKRFGVV